MELLKQPIVWIGGIFVGVLAAWLKGFLNQFLPAPQRVWLGIKNLFLNGSSRPEGRFRFVLCWLKNDDSGRDTTTAEQAFSGIEGIELVRSARIVAASGAADYWRPAMREDAREVLDKWNADLAIIGLVKESRRALNLWFVPREGDGTLPRADKPYELKNVTLQEEFHEDLRAQLATEALRAVAPLADTEVRGQVLEKELGGATRKLAALLEGSAIIESERRADLSLAHGNALLTLGERESGLECIEQAVAKFEETLKVFTRESKADQWARTQNSRGAALMTLWDRKKMPECLEQAVAAFEEALKVFTREREPLKWAATQNNLGMAFAFLGGSEHLERAVAAFKEALKVFTRESVPLDWAVTQNNLGDALRILGERESESERLERAVAAFKEALTVYTCKNVPLKWAMTQNSLGDTLRILGERETGSERLEQAVIALEKALQVFTCQETPHRNNARNNHDHVLALLHQRRAKARTE